MHSAAMQAPLLGFDENGTVLDLGHVVHRRIRPEYKARAAQVFAAYQRAGLAQKGVVETTLRADGDLEHRKLVISYPFEWPANMYKDAVLFHLDLLAELDEAGLTLKDALPSNILFDGASPVMVDFLSLVPRDALGEESWLRAAGYADPRFAVLRTMLLPYVLLPLVFMARGDYAIARELLSTRSCNCAGTPPAWRELLKPPAEGGRRSRAVGYLRSLLACLRLAPFRYSAHKRNTAAFRAAVAALRRHVAAMEVTPPPSGYASYYDEKQEALSLADPTRFLPKQRAVEQVLQALRPSSVLDLGANTGWYSSLAASHGARVIALEQDEACIDVLYRKARKNHLPILALKGSFADLRREIHGAPGLAPQYADRDLGAVPLYRAGIERLHAELVLMLGLLHHLVLGEGRTLEVVLDDLAALAGRAVVLEFVSLEDEKIIASPDFFPRLAARRDGYSLDAAIAAGRQRFREVEVLPSHPATRTLLVLRK